MIAQMEDAGRDDAITAAYFAYALTLAHKHVPEIMTRAGISRRPIFTPAVGRFAQGMLVNVPLHLDLMTGDATMADVHAALAITTEAERSSKWFRSRTSRQCPARPGRDSRAPTG
jgi:N-acetyl-gamma-glutamyl-phosphate reductase